MQILPVAIAVTLALAGPALAESASAKMPGQEMLSQELSQDQNATAPATTPASANVRAADSREHSGAQTDQIQSDGLVRQQLADSLTQAGFTDVEIMPASFVVRAKDTNGNPVMLVISRESVAAALE